MSVLILLLVVALLVVGVCMVLFFVLKLLAMLAFGAAVALGVVVFSISENYVGQEAAAGAAIVSVLVAIAILSVVFREGSPNGKSQSGGSPWESDSSQEAMYEALRKETRKGSSSGKQSKTPSLWDRIFGSQTEIEQDGIQKLASMEKKINRNARSK